MLCLAVCLAWMALHEGGHVIAGIATGSRVRGIEILSLRPHVELEGSWSAAQTAWICVAGSGAFLLAWFCFILAAPLRRMRLLTEVSAFLAGVELLAWTLAALQYPGGSRSYDVWKFLRYSGANSLGVALGAVSIAAAGWFLLRLRLREHQNLQRFPVKTPREHKAVSATRDFVSGV